MAKATHKGTELNNVQETWNENEKRGADPANPNSLGEPTTVSNDMQKTIEKEAAAYDDANKEERLLGGDRASVDDES